MKVNLLAILTFLTLHIAVGQEVNYGGVYSYETNPEYGKAGVLYVHPNSDGTLLFYLTAEGGRPAFHEGCMLGEMKIISEGIADFTLNISDEGIDCSIRAKFSGDTVRIDTNGDSDRCGFGYGVRSDGTYFRKQRSKSEFYVDQNGDTTMFKNVNWRSWWPETN